MPRSVDDITIALQVANTGGDLDLTTIDINTFKFTFADNPFAITLHAAHPVSDMLFNISADGTINLGEIEKIPFLSTVSLRQPLHSMDECRT